MSKEIIEHRRKQYISVSNRNYKEAQELKRVCDIIEENELNDMEQDNSVILVRRDAEIKVQRRPNTHQH